MRIRIALVALLAVVAVPQFASAQASRTGPTFRIGGTTNPVILPDVAYDPIHDRYLVVSGNGFIEGQLLDGAGNKLTSFPVALGSLIGGYTQTPRVAFSPDLNGGAGGYLVTWHESVGPIAQVRGKMVSTDGNALTGDIVLAPEAGAPGTGSYWVMGAAVAYSTTSKEFLVTWMGGYQTTQDIRYMRVNLAGQLLQATVAITGGVDWERDPCVTYNPVLDEFYIVYAGYLDAGHFGYVNGQRIKAGTGALVGGPATFIQAAATLIPAVEWNSTTSQYVVAWYNRTSSAAAFYGLTLNSDGTAASSVRVVSSRYVAYDALDVAYNRSSNDFLLVTHGAGLQDYEDAAVSLNGDGSPYDNGFILTNTPDVRPVVAGDGNFNPRVIGTGDRKYLAVTSSKFAAIHGQFATSSASGGAPAPGPVPAPAPISNPKMYLDLPGPNTTVQTSFAVAGWAVDLGTTAGTGIAAIHIWARPVGGGSPIFLGAANMGVMRTDISSYYANWNYAGAGFSLSASLPVGTYDITAYAFSTVAGAFNQTATVRITVVPPISNPKMYVDGPAQNQTVTQFFGVGGWAVDLAASSGCGVSAIHVWAYPVAGGSPVFVGATTAGGPGGWRPDVAAYFGDSRFGASGYYLQGTLPPGEYNLVVFAFSTVAGTFNQAAVIRIRVV
jgi:hypothetical protein